ncbi:MAG TPA: hypothetical protein PKY38_13885, partial [Opitutaceae bacterium]|nr:hypothetical protein [Opitutaceae bacterium]
MSYRPASPPPEGAALRLAHYESMLEDVPVGLLLLDRELRPLWFNVEAARACAVWNFGERKAAALRVREEFALPAALAEVCARLRDAHDAQPESPVHPEVVSDHTRGLHARIK